MELLSAIAVMAGSVLVVVIMGAVILALWANGTDARPLFLEQVLRRQGDALARRALASGSRDFSIAVQRCLACTEAAQCRAWLSSPARDGFQAFCPNAAFIERQKLWASKP